MKHFKFLVFLIFCLVQLSWGSSPETKTVETRLFALETSLESPNKLEVLAINSPRILYLYTENSEALITARVALQTHSEVSIEVDPTSSEIYKISLRSEKPSRFKARTFRWNPRLYSPSILPNYLKTKALFDSVDSYTDADLSDDCYNRAHYWSRAFEVEHKVKSMKVFLFFTPRYRKENNFNWWYHVAPYVNAKSSGEEKQFVLDPSYERLPVGLQKWIFHFASKANSCRVVKSIQEYEETQNQGGCAVIMASMYHYSPHDLDPVNPPVGWRCEDIEDVQKSLRAPAPYQNWADYTAFVPNHCR